MGTVQQDLLALYKRNQVRFKRTAWPTLQFSTLNLESKSTSEATNSNQVCAVVSFFCAVMVSVLRAAQSCYVVVAFLALCS